MNGNTVKSGRIVLGHVAPTPWVAAQAGTAIAGQSINEETASKVAEAAVAGATPLSQNGYKVTLARVAEENGPVPAGRQNVEECFPTNPPCSARTQAPPVDSAD